MSSSFRSNAVSLRFILKRFMTYWIVSEEISLARKNNLQVKVERGRGIWIQDATEVYVTSSEEMKCVHDAGHSNRAVAATRMNERSSRSHCLFIVTIF